MVHLNVLNQLLNDLVVSLFWSTVVRPRQVIKLYNLLKYLISQLIHDLELAPDQALHECLAAHERYLDALPVLVEGEALTDLGRPVLVTLHLAVLLGLREVDDEPRVLLQDHAPKVLLGVWEGSLRRDEGLVVQLDRAVDVVCVDVRVGSVSTALHQADTRVLERLEVGVTVEIHVVLMSVRFLVGQVLLGLGQLPQKAELSREVADEGLPLVVMERDAGFKLLDLVQLVYPLIGDVLRWFRALNKYVRIPSRAFRYLVQRLNFLE